ncbi:unnamed protein product [Camellia sinensis]
MSHFSPVAWTLKKTIVEFEGDFLVKRFFVTDSHENKIEDGEYERDRGEESWVSGGDAGDRKVLTRELENDGYSRVEVRVTPIHTEIIIRATRTQNVLDEKEKRILRERKLSSNGI